MKQMFPVEELARDERFVRMKIEDAILDPGVRIGHVSVEEVLAVVVVRF